MEQYLKFALRIKSLPDSALSIGLCKLFHTERFLHNCDMNDKGEYSSEITSDQMHAFLATMFRKWKGYSGDARYPIEIYNDIDLMHQFYLCRDFYNMPWIKRIYHKDRFFAKRYTKARRALLDHIISELEHQLVNSQEVFDDKN